MSSITPKHENHAARRQLRVGGITFFISFNADTPLNLEPDIAYSEFESNDFSLSHPYDIRVSIKAMASHNYLCQDLRLVYASDTSWSLFQKGDGYVIQLFPSVFDRPLWEAETNSEFSDVTVHVYCPPSPNNQQGRYFYPLRYPLDQIILMHYLGLGGGLIVHSAGIRIHDKVYIFPGISGAGKSTITSYLIKNDTFQVINDDRMIIRKQKNKFYAYGTPWSGEAGISVNTRGELGGIFFLNKARKNRVEQLSPQDGFEKLMPVASIPWHNKKMVFGLLEFCEQLVQDIPVYNLYFTPTSDLNDLIGATVN